jgi:hypothetical protein
MSQSAAHNGKTKRVAYTIIERGEGKSFWLRVGTAFENRDGSLNVYLDAIPINGRLQIREYQPDDEREGHANAAGNNADRAGHERVGNERAAGRRLGGARNG